LLSLTAKNRFGSQEKKNGRLGMATFLSILFPGLGQLYNRRFLKGALMAFVGLCLLVGFRSSPLPKEDIMFVIAFPYFVLWVYGIIDAWSGAKGQ